MFIIKRISQKHKPLTDSLVIMRPEAAKWNKAETSSYETMSLNN